MTWKVLEKQRKFWKLQSFFFQFRFRNDCELRTKHRNKGCVCIDVCIRATVNGLTFRVLSRSKGWRFLGTKYAIGIFFWFKTSDEQYLATLNLFELSTRRTLLRCVNIARSSRNGITSFRASFMFYKRSSSDSSNGPKSVASNGSYFLKRPDAAATFIRRGYHWEQFALLPSCFFMLTEFSKSSQDSFFVENLLFLSLTSYKPFTLSYVYWRVIKVIDLNFKTHICLEMNCLLKRIQGRKR